MPATPLLSSVATRDIVESLDGPVVITGACGFVGANLCRALVSRGVSILAIDGPSGNDWRIRGVSGIRRDSVDICSRQIVREYLLDVNPSVVVNCAAFGAYPAQQDPDRIYRVNFDAVRFLLEVAADLPRLVAFIQAGSSSEYGLNCTQPSESSATQPDSNYAVSKVAASALVQYYGSKIGVPAWTLRLYSVYGPLEDFSRLVPRLLLEAKEKRLPPLVNPAISRDFVHIDDVCRAVMQVVERASVIRKGEIYNVGTGIRTSLSDLVTLVRRQFHISDEPAWGSMPDRRWDHADWFADPSKARKDLGWAAAVSLSDGLASTMKWIDENPEIVLQGQRKSVAPKP
ncbi:MAG TPA: NAD(P)-dependent oxidoreductase [Polyangiaceae bacterium]|nr:NAD(P)-dependent oxidoreductase [Polyangiaceae bacterium]